MRFHLISQAYLTSCNNASCPLRYLSACSLKAKRQHSPTYQVPTKGLNKGIRLMPNLRFIPMLYSSVSKSGAAGFHPKHLSCRPGILTITALARCTSAPHSYDHDPSHYHQHRGAQHRCGKSDLLSLIRYLCGQPRFIELLGYPCSYALR